MKQYLKIKDVLNLNKNKDYGFVNCYVNEDTELFIDYNLLKRNVQIPYFDRQTACDKVVDFFKQIFYLIRTNQDEAHKNILIHEINDTHFGLTKKGNESRGKGPVTEALDDFFKKIVKNDLDKKAVNEPMDLLIFTKGLGPDFFSDLITKIISKELYDFSVKILTKYNKIQKVQQNTKKEITFWDNKNHKMKTLNLPRLSIQNSDILLVPYTISSKQIEYNANKFLNSVINNVKRQREINKLGKKNAKTKKDILESQKKQYGTNETKDIVFNEVLQESSFLKNYHNKFKNKIFLENHVHPLLNDEDIY